MEDNIWKRGISQMKGWHELVNTPKRIIMMSRCVSEDPPPQKNLQDYQCSEQRSIVVWYLSGTA